MAQCGSPDAEANLAYRASFGKVSGFTVGTCISQVFDRPGGSQVHEVYILNTFV